MFVNIITRYLNFSISFKQSSSLSFINFDRELESKYYVLSIKINAYKCRHGKTSILMGIKLCVFLYDIVILIIIQSFMYYKLRN